MLLYVTYSGADFVKTVQLKINKMDETKTLFVSARNEHEAIVYKQQICKKIDYFCFK
jgi:hypothetical protein